MALISLEEAKWQINYDGTDRDDYLEQLCEDATDIVIDYIKRPDHEWTEDDVPGPIRAAIRLVLTNLYAHRGDDTADPISNAVQALVWRYRDPALA